MQKWAPLPPDTFVNERDKGQRFWAWIKCILMNSNMLRSHVNRSLNLNSGGLSLTLLSRNNQNNTDKKNNYVCSSSSFALVFQHVFPTTSAPHGFCQWQQPWLLLITWLKCAFSFSFTQPAVALLLHKATCVYFFIASTRFTSAELPSESSTARYTSSQSFQVPESGYVLMVHHSSVSDTDPRTQIQTHSLIHSPSIVQIGMSIHFKDILYLEV